MEFSKQHRSKHFLQPFGIEYDFTLVDAVDKVPVSGWKYHSGDALTFEDAWDVFRALPLIRL